MLNRSKSEVMNRFVLPSGIATNSEELRHLQKKLLQNHYQSFTPAPTGSKNEFYSSSPNKNEQVLTDKGMREYYDVARQSQKQMKTSLSSDLLQQIRIKNQQKQQERQLRLNQEQQLSKHIVSLDALEKQKQRQFDTKYKMEALEDLKIKQSNRIRENIRNASEKQYYKNTYAPVEITQSQLLPKNNSYSNPTQQYYYELDKALRDRDGGKVANPEFSKNSSFKITRRAESLGQLDFMTQGEGSRNQFNQQSSYYQSLQNRSMQEKQELKNVLLGQMRQKEDVKKSEKIQAISSPYTTQKYQEMHHPIYNPVDFRYAHDNRYVLNELSSLK